MRVSGFFYRHFPRLTFLRNKVARENFEPEMKLLDLLCDPGKLSVDVGAKVGMYTYRLLAHSERVVAFEPIPRFNQMLSKVFLSKACRIEHCALSNRNGTAVLRMPYKANGSTKYGRATIHAKNQLTHAEIATVDELAVPVKTLDEYQFTNLGFIKVDVEGHEVEVLEGAKETIERNHPILLVESNDEHSTDAVASLARWLRNHDYQGFYVSGNELLAIEEFNRSRNVGLENFICLHKSAAAMSSMISARLPL